MRLRLALALAFGLTAGHLAWGQSATSGALSGSVRDPAAAPVANAAVALTNLATNQSFASVTDANGRYRFSLLPPGAYRVIFTAKGFKSASLVSATVDVAEAPILDATLDPGDTAEQAQCKCQFSAGGSSTGTLVDQKTITKYVRLELVPRVRAMTANHLKVRKLLQRLSDANWRLLQLPPPD